ncbi:MAG: fumarylacetoacetate hydrolase family protein [Oscillospiraceae bacterium]|nr:fumarylacetoacetate hydrolase family protein [Oscillospiraceae bacterium]
MKLARVSVNGQEFNAAVEDKYVRKINGCFFSEYELTNELYPISDVKFLAPVRPVNVLCIGLNYGRHAAESNMNLPKRPLIFLKTTTAVAGPEDDVIIPSMAPDKIDYEAELVVVIGKKARNVEPADAFKYVLGYTCGNDVSARDCQLEQDGQWARGKSFDTFAPIGPWIETDIDPENLEITGSLNGEIRQHSNTNDMLFPVSEVISYCSKNMTLLPGTIIMTGTPAGVILGRNPAEYIKPGDVYKVEIEGIGTLQNKFKAE